MKNSTVNLNTINGNATVKCQIKPKKILKFNWLSDVTFSYGGYSFVLEDRTSKGGLVGKSISTKNGKTLVTWIKVCPKSEVFKHLELINKNNKRKRNNNEYGSMEWWANGMIEE